MNDDRQRLHADAGEGHDIDSDDEHADVEKGARRRAARDRRYAARDRGSGAPGRSRAEIRRSRTSTTATATTATNMGSCPRVPRRFARTTSADLARSNSSASIAGALLRTRRAALVSGADRLDLDALPSVLAAERRQRAAIARRYRRRARASRSSSLSPSMTMLSPRRGAPCRTRTRRSRACGRASGSRAPLSSPTTEISTRPEEQIGGVHGRHREDGVEHGARGDGARSSGARWAMNSTSGAPTRILACTRSGARGHVVEVAVREEHLADVGARGAEARRAGDRARRLRGRRRRRRG